MIELAMTFGYPDRARAEAVLASVGPENGGFVEAGIDGCTVSFSVRGEEAATVRATADDLLACVKAAEASMGIASRPEEDEE